MCRPGVGKTTVIREMARVLADDFHKRVVIVDTSNEIGGDGDVPHPAIGGARRMQVSSFVEVIFYNLRLAMSPARAQWTFPDFFFFPCLQRSINAGPFRGGYLSVQYRLPTGPPRDVLMVTAFQRTILAEFLSRTAHEDT